MRTATLVANLLSLAILAVTCVYVQVALAEVISLAGRMSLGFAGAACLLAPLVLSFRSRLARDEQTVR